MAGKDNSIEPSAYNVRKIRDIYKGRLIDLSLKEVTFPDFKKAEREIVVHPGAVAVVPFIDNDHIVLIRQFRTAADDLLWELPAGTIESGEVPEDCALRELKEETGYLAGSIRPLNSFFLAPGYSTERIRLFAAYELNMSEQQLEEDERIKTYIVSKKDAESMISRGEIVDAKTIIGILIALSDVSFANSLG